MTEFIDALKDYSFLQRALAAGLLASVGCGLTGTYVVVKRMGLLAGGIAHAILGGMGIAYFLGYPPLPGAVVAALIAALLIAWISLRHGEQEDIVVSALWALGMAIGVIFIAKTPGYSTDLMSYLFGNILLVKQGALALMALLDLLIIAVVLICYRQFLAVSFDEEFARLRGIRTNFYYTLLLCLIALTIVLLIPVVGLILVIALLTLPAAIAVHLSHSLARIMMIAIALGMLFTTSGLALSYTPDLPAGASIIVVAGGTYMVVIATAGLLKTWRASRAASRGQS